MIASELAEAANLFMTLAILVLFVKKALVRYFFSTPTMRQDRIFRHVLVIELCELQCSAVQQPHFLRSSSGGLSACTVARSTHNMYPDALCDVLMLVNSKNLESYSVGVANLRNAIDEAIVSDTCSCRAQNNRPSDRFPKRATAA